MLCLLCEARTPIRGSSYCIVCSDVIVTSIERYYDDGKEYEDYLHLEESAVILAEGVKYCPNCNRLLDISAINCGVFRCIALSEIGYSSLTKDQIAHASKEEIRQWTLCGWVLSDKCCGVPFVIHNINDEPIIPKDENGENCYL